LSVKIQPKLTANINTLLITS